jgi:hypothetical protein
LGFLPLLEGKIFLPVLCPCCKIKGPISTFQNTLSKPNHYDNQNFPSKIKETHSMILIESHPKQINHQSKASTPRLEILFLASKLDMNEHEFVAAA